MICEKCPLEATEIVWGLVEQEPVRDAQGNLCRTWKHHHESPHSYCKKHLRGSKEYMLDGSVRIKRKGTYI